MDLELGLEILKKLYHEDMHSEAFLRFSTLEARLRSNIQRERDFGSHSSIRSEQAEIVRELNRLALSHFEISFTEMCIGKASSVPDVQKSEQVEEDLSLRSPTRLILRSPLKFKTKLSQMTAQQYRIEVLESAKGETEAVSNIPYTPEELTTVLKALQSLTTDVGAFSEDQKRTLERFNLWSENKLVPVSNLLERVGRQFYDSLISDGDIRITFEVTRSKAFMESSYRPLHFQMQMGANSVELARFPWELLHNGHHHLLISRDVDITRYILHNEPPRDLKVRLPLRMLYISSHPVDLPSISHLEHVKVRDELYRLEKKGILAVHDLPVATFEQLVKFLNANGQLLHILHFDGHGAFARACPVRECAVLNRPHLEMCANCGINLRSIEPRGHLAFESSADRKVKWLPSDKLGHLLRNTSVRLVVLSACSSATVRGQLLFAGTGPALVQAGVPAVVSFQLPISVTGASLFSQSFYSALARFESILSAVSTGRRQLFDTYEWFVPALYLRSRDDEGYLFQSSFMREKENVGN